MHFRTRIAFILAALVVGCQQQPDPLNDALAVPANVRCAPTASSGHPILVVPTPSSDPVFRVGAGVTEPVELSRVVPAVPEDCRGSKYSGMFIFEAVIDRDGTVRDVRTLNRAVFDPPCPHVENAYRRAIAQWRYQPAAINNEPVAVYLTVTVMPSSHSR